MRRKFEYLFFFYENKNRSVNLSEIAKNLNVKKPSALEVINRLCKKKYLIRINRGNYKITKKGKKIIEEILWKHSVLEWIFVKNLNINKEIVCKIIQNIEDNFPKEIIKKFCELNKHPLKCPHGIENPHPDYKIRKSFKYCKI